MKSHFIPLTFILFIFFLCCKPDCSEERFHTYHYLDSESKKYNPYNGNETFSYLYVNKTDTDTMIFKGQSMEQKFDIKRSGSTEGCLFYDYYEYRDYKYVAGDHSFLIRNRFRVLEIYFDSFENDISFSSFYPEIHKRLKNTFYFDSICITGKCYEEVYMLRDFRNNFDSSYLYYQKENGILKFIDFSKKEQFLFLQ